MAEQVFYRGLRPEVRPDELAAWIRDLGQPVIVHRPDQEKLAAAGAANAVALPVGGPLRGEVWVPA